MIVEYDNDGKIFHIVRDPVPPTLAEVMLAAGKKFLDLPVRVATKNERDPETGHMVPVVTHEYAKCEVGTHYVENGKLRERPLAGIGMKLRGSLMVMTGVPAGSSVAAEFRALPNLHSKTEFTADGDEIELEVDEPGKLMLVITPPWPLREEKHEIEIV